MIWDWMSSPTAESWTAIAAWVAVAIAAATAFWARKQVVVAREAQREQSRPYVVVKMEANAHHEQVVELVIKNYGPTAALDTRIVSTPRLRRVDGSSRTTSRDVWLPDLIPTLAPGQEWRTVWDHAPERMASPELKEERRHEIATTYLDPAGHEYTSTYVLDWGAYEGLQYIGVKTIHHAATALGKISRRLESWDARGGRGMKIVARLPKFEDGDDFDDLVDSATEQPGGWWRRLTEKFVDQSWVSRSRARRRRRT